MRLFVLLALVAFTGCQANEPTPQLDQMEQAFWDYLTNAAQTAKSTLITIKETELGQQVSTKIEESAFVARQYALVLQDQVSVVGQESFDKVAEQVDLLKERLRQDVSVVRAKLEPYTEKLMDNIKQKVEKLLQEVSPYTESLDAETLKASLLQRSEELKQTLEQSVKELQAQLGPYTEELKEKVDQRMQEFQQSVTPLAESLQTQLAQRAKMLQQSLAPYAEDLREKLDPYAQDLKSWLHLSLGVLCQKCLSVGGTTPCSPYCF